MFLDPIIKAHFLNFPNILYVNILTDWLYHETDDTIEIILT